MRRTYRAFRAWRSFGGWRYACCMYRHARHHSLADAWWDRAKGHYLRRVEKRVGGPFDA